MNGKVVRVNTQKLYGFIRSIDGKDYFFHRDDQINYDGLLGIGMEVEFEPKDTPKGPRAEAVKYVVKTESKGFDLSNYPSKDRGPW